MLQLQVQQVEESDHRHRRLQQKTKLTKVTELVGNLAAEGRG